MYNSRRQDIYVICQFACNICFPGGVVLFTRSLTPYKREGIRVNTLCPEVKKSLVNVKILDAHN